jgi:hypothetical protein
MNSLTTVASIANTAYDMTHENVVNVSKYADKAINYEKRWTYHFNDGSAGWKQAFQEANDRKCYNIYFPQGKYFFDGLDTGAPINYDSSLQKYFPPVVIDLDNYPNLKFKPLNIYGDGTDITQFWGDGVVIGNQIEIKSTTAFGNLGWKIFGFSIICKAAGDGLCLFTNIEMNGGYIYNIGVRNLCPSNYNRNSTIYNATSALRIKNFWSGLISTDICTVQTGTSTPYSAAGLILDKVQYTIVDPRGLNGIKDSNMAFNFPNPSQDYYGLSWGMIIKNYCTNLTIHVMHIEVSANGLFIEDTNCSFIDITNCLMSMIAGTCILSRGSHVTIKSININKYEIDGQLPFSDKVEMHGGSLYIEKGVFTDTTSPYPLTKKMIKHGNTEFRVNNFAVINNSIIVTSPTYEPYSTILFYLNTVVLLDSEHRQYTLSSPALYPPGYIITIINAAPCNHAFYANTNYWVNNNYNKFYVPSYGSITLMANTTTYTTVNMYNPADADQNWALVRV